MFRKTRIIFVPLILATLIYCNPALSSQKSKTEQNAKSAIIIASFGTTVPRGIEAITNITNRVKTALPETEVKITFTSNIIRSVWRKRQANPQKWLEQGVPEEILYVENIISVIGDLREEGYRNIIVQPTHIFYMEQSYDLNAYVQALGSINTMKARWRPFDKIVMGRPALGMPGDLYDYNKDVEKAVKTLSEDAKRAAKENSILIYMGHGNEYWPTGIYGETQKAMRETYPDVDTFIGVAEGSPALEDFLKHLENTGKKKIILKPFMIVAGSHAVNDMAGEEKDSWKSILQDNGYQVEAVLEGLGSNNGFADLFVDHIKDTARDHEIILH